MSSITRGRPGRVLALTVAGLLIAAAALTASTAQAAQVLYPQNEAQRNFDSGAAGWTGTGANGGLCIPVVNCPTITNTAESSGGIDDSGYLRTELGASLIGIAATSTATWTSPPFTYDGVDGERPEDLQMRFSRTADVAALLDVIGTSATYTVRILEDGGGVVATPIAGDDLAGATGWSNIVSAPIADKDLDNGEDYRIQIESTFANGVNVIPGASVGYDGVRLVARRTSDGDGDGGNGGDGDGDGDGNGGNGGDNDGNGGGGVVGGKAVYTGKRLIVRVRCPKRSRKVCHLRVSGRLFLGGPRFTNNRRLRLRPGKVRRVKLRVRPHFKRALKNRKRVIIKVHSKRGNAKRARVDLKPVKLRHRH